MTEVPVPAKLKADNLKIPNEKFKEKFVVTGLKVDTVQISAVKFLGKSFVMLGEIGTRWRPKTRAKNKLRLNMKKILNPILMKEKVTVIEDSSSQEDMEEEENFNSQQIHINKEKLVILESSICKDKVAEQSIDFSTERVRSLEFLAKEEAVKNEEDDDLIFRKMNIPWLSDKTSTL